MKRLILLAIFATLVLSSCGGHDPCKDKSLSVGDQIQYFDGTKSVTQMPNPGIQPEDGKPVYDAYTEDGTPYYAIDCGDHFAGVEKEGE